MTCGMVVGTADYIDCKRKQQRDTDAETPTNERGSYGGCRHCRHGGDDGNRIDLRAFRILDDSPRNRMILHLEAIVLIKLL